MAYRHQHTQRPHRPIPPRPDFQPQPGTSYQPNHQPQPQPQFFSQPPVTRYANLSGGYQPYQYHQPIYPQPSFQQPSYPYYPTASYGQSSFPPQPAATPEGYSYSQSYLQEPLQSNARPAKRQRQNNIPGSTTGGGIQPWRNCSHPGCKFVGPGEEVDVHEGDRHLIFPKEKQVERSDEEERFLLLQGVTPTIQGTGRVLRTEEDIAKWLAERRANWPTTKRIAEKEADRQAALARGEIPRRGGGRGRGRGRGNGAFGRQDAAAQAEDWGRPAPVVNGNNVAEVKLRRARDNVTGRGRGDGRRRGQDQGRVGGGRQGASRRTDEGSFRPRPQSIPSQPALNITKVLDSAASIPVLGDYVSSQSSSDTSDSASDSASSASSSSSSSAGETARIPRAKIDPITKDLKRVTESHNTGKLERPDTDMMQSEQPGADTVRAQPPICEFYARTGRCRKGARCHFAHDVPGRDIAVPQQDRRHPVKQPVQKRANPFERPSMLGALLANPIQNTLSRLSQTIRFLVANDMLEGVELQPGDAEEVERGEEKVVVLDDSGRGKNDMGMDDLDDTDESVHTDDAVNRDDALDEDADE